MPIPLRNQSGRAAALCPVLALLVALSAAAQDRRPIRIAQPDRTVEAALLGRRKPVEAKPDRDYFWCIGQRIMRTQGGIAGELLDGPYVEYHPNGQLMTQGRLSKGLRVGVWREWDAEGRLLRTTPWKQGRKHGRAITYDPAGGAAQLVRYRRGDPVAPRASRQAAQQAEEGAPTQRGRRQRNAATGDAPGTTEERKKSLSKRMRNRDEQNKGTKQEVVRKRKERKERPQPATP